MSMPIRGNVPSLIRYSSDDYSNTDNMLSGLLSDNRSGEAVLSKISSLNDLAEHFPAVTVYAEEMDIPNKFSWNDYCKANMDITLLRKLLILI